MNLTLLSNCSVSALFVNMNNNVLNNNPPELNLQYLDIDDNMHLLNNCQFNDIDQINNEKDDFHSFNVLCVNIRSCRKNFSQLQLFLSNLAVKFQIISLVETWLDPIVDHDFKLPDYKVFNVYRNEHGGGIKMFVINTLQCEEIKNFCSITPCLESLFIELKLASEDSLIVGCVYRPPSVPLTDFNDLFFEAYVTPFLQKNTVIMGDFNANLYNPLSLSTISDFMSNFLALGFSPLIRFPHASTVKIISPNIQLLTTYGATFLCPLNPV